MKKLFLSLAVIGMSGAAAAQDISVERLNEVIDASFGDLTDDLRARIVQDETQEVCSSYRDMPPAELADAILERELASVVFPEDDNLMGDWKYALDNSNNGWGWRIGDNNPNREIGGNCYACHQLTEEEVGYGNLGPSLLGYGKGFEIDAEFVMATYTKIYNAQAILPCSQMPRFGATGFLTPEQITHYVAMLLDPESPVNQ